MDFRVVYRIILRKLLRALAVSINRNGLSRMRTAGLKEAVRQLGFVCYAAEVQPACFMVGRNNQERVGMRVNVFLRHLYRVVEYDDFIEHIRHVAVMRVRVDIGTLNHDKEAVVVRQAFKRRLGGIGQHRKVRVGMLDIGILERADELLVSRHV